MVEQRDARYWREHWKNIESTIPKDDPESASNIWNNNGLSLRTRHPEHAIKYIDKAIEINPNNSDAWYNKIVTLYCLGRKVEAKRLYYENIENLSDMADLLGSNLSEYGMDSDAIGYYHEALKSDPNSLMALIGLSESLIKLLQYRESIKYSKQAIELFPDSPYGYYHRARANSRIGNTKQAIIDLSDAIKLDNTQSIFRDIRGLQEGQSYLAELAKKENDFTSIRGNKKLEAILFPKQKTRKKYSRKMIYSRLKFPRV